MNPEGCRDEWSDRPVPLSSSRLEMRSHRRRKHRNAARPVEPRGVRGTPSTVPTNGQEEQYPLGIKGSTGPCKKEGRARVTQAREFIGTAEHAAVTKRSSFGRRHRPLSRATTCGGKAITTGPPRGTGNSWSTQAPRRRCTAPGERNPRGASRPGAGREATDSAPPHHQAPAYGEVCQ